MKYLLFSIAICAAVLVFYTISGNKRPNTLGLINGRLATCPDSPNCVSSQAADKAHKVLPIAITGDAEAVMPRLVQTIESMPGAKVITKGNRYLHAEFTSKVWRFVDDLECHYDQKKGRLEVRSASRVGYSDLGVNRKRVERLRTMLEK